MLIALALPGLAVAAQDKPGGHDHPLVSRYAGSVLSNYGTINFDKVTIPLSNGQSMTVEGKVSSYFYRAPADHSSLEVFRNFQEGLKTGGFSIVYTCESEAICQQQQLYRHAAAWTEDARTFDGGFSADSRMDGNGNYPPRYLVARRPSGEGSVIVVLTVKSASSTEQSMGTGGPYFLQVIETQPMQTGQVQVSADAMRGALSADGRIALYGFYFDTGKAVLKGESRAQLDELAALLRDQPGLNVMIVGHTDNQGSRELNLDLSQRRADAVVQALVRDYQIQPLRLEAHGVANFAPVASNTTRAGRSRNRRVEVVEQ